MNNKMREEFEERFPVPPGVAWSDEHQSYGWVKKSAFQSVITYRALFTGWKASREGIVLELPSFRFGRQLNGDELEEQDDGDYLFYHEVVEIIEAQGFKVKTK